MNRVEFIGNLSKAPDVKQTTSGKTVCSLTIAVNRRYKDAQGNATADFFSVQAWEKLAELCARYLDKGSKVFVSGELRNRSYEAKDGSKRTVTEIIANEVEFLSPKSESAPAGSTAVPPVEKWEQVEDSDLPF